MLVPLALLRGAALPVAAYLAGHPFRMRYEIPLVVAAALAIGLASACCGASAPVVAVAICRARVWERPPFDARAPMVAEAQLDRNAAGARDVTACLQDAIAAARS